MLSIAHYTGPARGKSRGKWSFYAAIDGNTWELYGKGRSLLGMRYWSASEDGGTHFYSPFSPRPSSPPVDPALIAHVRAILG